MGAVELGAQGKAPMTQHEIREPFSRMLPGAESEAVLETVEAYGQLCAGNLLLFVGRGEAGGAALAVKLLGQAVGYVQAVVGIQTGGKRRVRVRKGLPLPGHRAQADFPQGFECLAAQGGNGREREKVFRGECDRDVAGFELRTAEFGQGLFQAGFLGRVGRGVCRAEGAFGVQAAYVFGQQAVSLWGGLQAEIDGDFRRGT